MGKSVFHGLNQKSPSHLIMSSYLWLNAALRFHVAVRTLSGCEANRQNRVLHTGYLSNVLPRYKFRLWGTRWTFFKDACFKVNPSRLWIALKKYRFELLRILGFLSSLKRSLSLAFYSHQGWNAWPPCEGVMLNEAQNRCRPQWMSSSFFPTP